MRSSAVLVTGKCDRSGLQQRQACDDLANGASLASLRCEQKEIALSRQLLLVAYDVADPRRLATAREAVSAWAAGGQRSVFECYAAPADRRNLERAMQRALAFDEDRLGVFLTRAETAKALGIGAIARDEPLVWVG